MPFKIFKERLEKRKQKALNKAEDFLETVTETIEEPKKVVSESSDKLANRIKNFFGPKKNTTVDEHSQKLYSMNKKQLDEYAKEHYNIELDRRQTKANMIEEFTIKLKGDN